MNYLYKTYKYKHPNTFSFTSIKNLTATKYLSHFYKTLANPLLLLVFFIPL